jgi:hypothetical protein
MAAGSKGLAPRRPSQLAKTNQKDEILHVLRAMILLLLSGGLAWAQDPQCSVSIGDVQITVTDPVAGNGSANASCQVITNFPATITPTVEPAEGFKNPANNHWVWTATINGQRSKEILPEVESDSPINVTLSGVTPSEPAIASFTKVATLIVTITADESKAFFGNLPIKPLSSTGSAAKRPQPMSSKPRR